MISLHVHVLSTRAAHNCVRGGSLVSLGWQSLSLCVGHAHVPVLLLCPNNPSLIVSACAGYSGIFSPPWTNVLRRPMADP